MKDEQIIDLVVNWLNETKIAEGMARFTPTMYAMAFCLWLNEKGCISNVPEELLERPDLEAAKKEDAENTCKIFNIITQNIKQKI